MKVLAICLIALVASANCVSLFEQFPMNFSPKRSIMTLLTQVEAKMKSGGPLDAITKMLQEFVTSVTQEQAQHDQLHSKQAKECESEFAFREQEIKEAVAALQEGQQTLDGCNAQKVRATQDLASTKKQLTDNRHFLAEVEEERRNDAYAFETATGVYQRSSRAVEEALQILEEIWEGESSFAQLTKHVNGMLKDAVKLRKAHLLGGVIAALAQLSSKDLQADEALFERVKTLLTNFKNKLDTEFQQAVAAEEASVKQYNEDKARLTSTISHLEEQKAGLEQELNTLDKCIVVQTGIVNSSSAKRDRNQKLFDDAKNLCSAVDDEYKAATEARNEELDLLAAIKERVEVRFGQISTGVQDRGKQDEFKYDNAYEYKQPEFKSK